MRLYGTPCTYNIDPTPGSLALFPAAPVPTSTRCRAGYEQPVGRSGNQPRWELWSFADREGDSIFFCGCALAVRPRETGPRYGVEGKPELGLGSFKVAAPIRLPTETSNIAKNQEEINTRNKQQTYPRKRHRLETRNMELQFATFQWV